jgi:hypothetical protein
MFLLLALIACHDSTITVNNSEPEVSVTAPFDGAVVPAEVPFELVALVSDDLTPLEELQVQWTSDLDGMLPGTVEYLDGEATMVVGEGVSVGEHLLTITVFDAKGASNSDAVSIEALIYEPPSLELLSLEDGDLFTPDSPMQVVAYITDDFDEPEALTLDLVSSVSGSLEHEVSFNGGTATFEIAGGLEAEDQTLTLEAFDTGGEHSEVSVSLEADRNQPPVITFDSPVPEEIYEEPSLWVEVRFWDPETTDYSELELSWSGLVASPHITVITPLPSNPGAEGRVRSFLEFDCEALGAAAEPNTFVLGLAATDRGGATGTAETEVQLRCAAD